MSPERASHIPPPRCLSLVLPTSILCLALISTSAAIVGREGDNKHVFERLDGDVTAEATGHSFRGVVLVGMNGEVVFKKAYGMADEEWNVHNTTTTKFRIASLSKQFTRACILLLQERGG